MGFGRRAEFETGSQKIDNQEEQIAFIFVDYLGNEIHLTDEVCQVALTKHPEAGQFFELVGETLASPDIVKKSQTDSRVNLYYKFYSKILNGKFVVIVVKYAERYFISTFYATDKIKQGEVVWKK